jgi:SAM-dependent methyltransferase
LYGFKIDLVVAVVLQGIFAACGARLCSLASWWVWIQLLFPLALLGTYSLHFPPLVFLVLFIFFVALYWSCFRTQVPFYPSRHFASCAVLQLLTTDRQVRFIDIGSGLGGLVLHLAAARPNSEFIGIELAPLPWLISRLRSVTGNTNARFLRGDYQHLNFAQFDIVFAYLSPAVMSELWLKAKAEMRPGTMLLSYEFSILGKRPDLTILDTNGGPALYGWHF